VRKPRWSARVTILFVFSVMATASPAQTFTTLVNFDGPNGAAPAYMSLVQGADGSVFGTTESGGGGDGNYCAFYADGCGTVFSVTRGGSLRTLYAFCAEPPCIDGANPQAGLTLGTDGSFYGTTEGGGAFNSGCEFDFGCGTVFKIGANGTLTTLYVFCSGFPCIDGASPSGGLVQVADGSFYGVTSSTIFKITENGELSTVYNFCSEGTCSAPGGLVQGSDGNLYGTTAGGGAFGKGSVFKMTKKGSLTTLYSFCAQPNCADGSTPIGNLVEGADRAFYGTTNVGGTNCSGGFGSGCGTVFRVTREGTLTVLHTFEGPDGDVPRAGLIQANDGKLYGTTFGDGINTQGTVFSITTAGILNTLHIFEGTDGAGPWGGLLQATNGVLYGTTFGGGSGGYTTGGTVFSLDMGLRPFVAFVRNAAKVGQKFGILGQGLSGATSVAMNGVQASFNVVSDTFITATVPEGATTGYATVTTPTGLLKSDVAFQVIP
jgi:uncharacterized repeat protein (TIGR03803 family)